MSMNRNARTENSYHLAGWILFILCAFFFLASAIKNKDTLTLIGCIVFLAGCITFLIPLLRRPKDPPPTEEEKT
jgi:predicted membrane channel-forming protein YqfA (hemolysin III family)